MNKLLTWCRLLGHRWQAEYRATGEGIACASVFRVRTCRRCQAVQVQGNGPMGDRQWHPVAPFPGDPWEAQRFAAATTEHYRKIYGK